MEDLEAAKESSPVILDFYADWCSPCRAADRNVFSDPGVLALSRKLVTLRVDLTRRHPGQDKLLTRYGVREVPAIIFIDRKGVEEPDLRVEENIGKDAMIQRMRTLLCEEGEGFGYFIRYVMRPWVGS